MMKYIDYREHPLYHTHSPHNLPSVSVSDGEVFEVHTQLCSGDWLQEPKDVWEPKPRKQSNACVCIRVEGTSPGQMLAVDILDIRPDAVGYTAFSTRTHTLARDILGDVGTVRKTVSIRDGVVEFSKRLRLPVQPMIGVLGTAPGTEEISNRAAGPHGGNMDAQEVSAGARVYLPVEAPGALLHVGDAHAIQGDGEINRAGGIECRVRATLRVQALERFPGMAQVRLENKEEIAVIAAHEETDRAFILAVQDLIRWMEVYGFSPEEAYMLLGQVMKARCLQFVNPTRTYICKIPKLYLYNNVG